jgi:uncharacterized membrane protein
MGWNTRYAMASYLRSSLWIVPLIALVLEQVAIRVAFVIGPSLQWLPGLATTPTGTIGAIDTIVSLSGAFVVFTFGSMLVAIQVASGQLTPRIIATTLLRDNRIRFMVGLFVFTLLFAEGTKVRGTTEVPQFAATIAAALGIGSMAAFLYLIDYTARLLRPIAIIKRLADEGIRVIASVYPDPVELLRAPAPARPVPAQVGRDVMHTGDSAIVLAVNLKALVALARAVDGVIEVVPRVGDFVATGSPLFRLHGGATGLGDVRLRAQVAFGPERTIEQDSMFAFRVIVDVAIKALSKAINDPTTAVVAIDQLHRLLRAVGGRHLHDDTLLDAEGRVRLILPTPDWADFVQLSFSEIRLYGAENFQVARRLRAMIGNLVATLPGSRRAELDRELMLLDGTLARIHAFPQDLALAREPDTQGLGGASPRNGSEPTIGTAA